MNTTLRKSLLAVPAFSTFALAFVLLNPGPSISATELAKSNAPATIAQTADYTVDPAHTALGFNIGHLGLSRVQGRFDKFSGQLQLNAKDITKSSVQIVAQADSVNTNVPPRDADLRSPNFFDVKKYPELTFNSTKISKKGNGYVASGTLTIHGVSQPVNISFKLYGPIKDPWGNQRIGIVTEPLTIHRSHFGMNYDADTVSDDVTVLISMEATQNKK